MPDGIGIAPQAEESDRHEIPSAEKGLRGMITWVAGPPEYDGPVDALQNTL